MIILAIDPAPRDSGYVILNSNNIELIAFGKVSNEALSVIIKEGFYDIIAMEMIGFMGMGVGKDVFETCVWIGRFLEMSGKPFQYIYRREEKINLCKSMKADDSAISKALVKRFAKFDFVRGKGNKKKHDYFYGFAGDMWSAFAVAITYIDLYVNKKQ
jgi:hypothetical protein